MFEMNILGKRKEGESERTIWNGEREGNVGERREEGRERERERKIPLKGRGNEGKRGEKGKGGREGNTVVIVTITNLCFLITPITVIITSH